MFLIKYPARGKSAHLIWMCACSQYELRLNGHHTKPTLFSVLWERNEMGLCYLAKISAITIFKELLCSAVTAIQNAKDRCSEISKQESGSEGIIGYLSSGNIYHILTDGKPHLNMKTQLTDPFLLPLSLTNTKTPPPHLHPYNTVSKDILWKGNMKRHVLHLFFIISLFLWIYLIKCKIKHLE